MAGREYLFIATLRAWVRGVRRAERSTAVIALVVALVGVGSLSLRGVDAGRAGRRAESSARRAAAAPQIADANAGRGVVVGEFEGYFDSATRRMTVQPRAAREGRGARGLNPTSRIYPGVEINPGSGFTFSVVASKFQGTGDFPGTVSGEVSIANATAATLYNTRLVFTAFKIGGPGGVDAGNVPGASGFAFFNDGLAPLDGKLHISRFYGDIPASGSVKNIWTFATVAQPPSFFFAYRVLADIGVAPESVQPAAVQVNANGTSVVISGRGFNNPTAELMQGTNVIGSMSVSNPTATSFTATVPGNTPAGIYSVRVTNQGATPGGPGSSTMVNKLTVTGVPDAGHTLSGDITSLADAGPFLVVGSANIPGALSVKPGTVIYMTGGSSLTVAGGGNIVANGGVPGIPGSAKDGANPAEPAQIVITSQRSPGGALPTAGAWNGIDATAASSAEMALRNVVVEFGGASVTGAIQLSTSGRKLRVSDSILRSSAGPAITALGAGESLVGFTRNLIENNGAPAMALSANAALGLYDLAGGDLPSGTSVGDGGYYFSSANVFTGNQSNIIQIGLDDDAASNDFTKSGVLVGQGIPFVLRGKASNPATVGTVSPDAPAELVITPAQQIQIAADTDFQAGDNTSKRGGIAANGYAGNYLGAEPVTSNRFIEFDKAATGGNFGSIFFSKNAVASSILSYVKVVNGGTASVGTVSVDTIAMKVIYSMITSTVGPGLSMLNGANVNTTGSMITNGGGGPGGPQIIETIAGGLLGDGNKGTQANFITPVVVATDSLGRGVFIVDNPGGISLIRFLNTTTNEVTFGGGVKVPGGTVKTIAGGGLDTGDNVLARVSDVGTVTGIAVNPTGDLLYFIDSGIPAVRVINLSTSSKTIAGATVGAGNVGTFASNSIDEATGFGSSLNGLGVHPTNGDVYVCDATAGKNKVFKLAPDHPSPGTAAALVAGNGASTRSDDPFSAGAATGIPLLQPRAVVVDSAGAVYVADTGHARVIKIEGGSASLMRQFPPKADSGSAPYNNNPFSSGLALFGGKLYIANGNAQDIARIDSPGNSTSIAGTIGASCDYTAGNPTCGDGGPGAAAAFSMLGSTGNPPLAGIAADANGIYIPDQGSIQRGRVRYLNLSGASVTIAGVTIAAGNIDTVAGTGLVSPFDGGLATSAAFNTPTGVSLDPNGNMWISDMLSSKIRFVNLGNADVTIFAGTPSEQNVPPGFIVTVNANVGAGATDGVPAIQGGFDTPQGIFATAQGVYVADSKKGAAVASRRTGLLRFMNTTSSPIAFYSGAATVTVAPGEIRTIAGGGLSSSDIGNGPAPLSAKFLAPEDVAIHPTTGDIFIADTGNKAVRKIVRSTGVVSSLVLPTGTSDQYTGIGFDSQGRLLVANAGANSILREKTAGSGVSANGFDTVLSGAPLNRPRDVAAGADGSLYVTNPGDSTPLTAGDYKVLKITAGVATVLTGSTSGYSGDGGPASNAQINNLPDPISIATVGSPVLIRTTVNILVGPNGEIVFTDSKNNAIRRIR
ncbi:MAG: hypothetical protein SF339_22850 [Blastocatellia bacterium]|nr:hypothetical protein [Blastocatellia bacterium]